VIVERDRRRGSRLLRQYRTDDGDFDLPRNDRLCQMPEHFWQVLSGISH
jgi:hypothetical protein